MKEQPKPKAKKMNLLWALLGIPILFTGTIMTSCTSLIGNQSQGGNEIDWSTVTAKQEDYPKAPSWFTQNIDALYDHVNWPYGVDVSQVEISGIMIPDDLEGTILLDVVYKRKSIRIIIPGFKKVNTNILL